MYNINESDYKTENSDSNQLKNSISNSPFTSKCQAIDQGVFSPNENVQQNPYYSFRKTDEIINNQQVVSSPQDEPFSDSYQLQFTRQSCFYQNSDFQNFIQSQDNHHNNVTSQANSFNFYHQSQNVVRSQVVFNSFKDQQQSIINKDLAGGFQSKDCSRQLSERQDQQLKNKSNIPLYNSQNVFNQDINQMKK